MAGLGPPGRHRICPDHVRLLAQRGDVMQVKITIDQAIADVLEKEAKAIGIKLPIYIKMLLGQHVAKKEIK